MSRHARLYLLDEPIAGVDPVAREYILRTIISTYNKEASVIISTHLITDVEAILDEYAFIWNGRVVEQGDVRSIREERGVSLDDRFKEVFRCFPNS
jgi:ABC-2 type transport system ATP-binding protein